MQTMYGINFLSKADIPVKGPDISSLDFSGLDTWKDWPIKAEQKHLKDFGVFGKNHG